MVGDRVGRFPVEDDLKVLYLAAKDATQEDAVRLTAFVPEPDPAPRNGGQVAEIRFGVATRACDTETFGVSVRGDVDLVTAPELEQELLEAAQPGARRVVVDLTEAAFFGSSAIHALMRSGERLRTSGLQFGLACGNPNIRKVLEIAGVDQAFQIHSTIEQAIRLTSSGDASPAASPATSHPVAAESYA
jgi:anti-sigma B factor antagonist